MIFIPPFLYDLSELSTVLYVCGIKSNKKSRYFTKTSITFEYEDEHKFNGTWNTENRSSRHKEMITIKL